MKKLMGITAVVLGIAMAAAPMSAFAAESTESTAEVQTIDFDKAAEAALADAGLTADEVTFCTKMNDYDNGIEIYDIEFIIPGKAKYSYMLDARTGEIIESESDEWEAEDDEDFKALMNETEDYFDLSSEESAEKLSAYMAAALEAAAPADADALCFYKSGLEYAEGDVLYEVGFFIPNEIRYEYWIDVKTGEVILDEAEKWEAEDNVEYQGLLEQ